MLLFESDDLKNARAAAGAFENMLCFHKYTYLERGIEVFRVLKSLVEDSSQPLVKIFALLHETHVVTHEILGTRWRHIENHSISFLHADTVKSFSLFHFVEFNSATWEEKEILEEFDF